MVAHKEVKKVVIPAAGLGTRFLPATKAQPKEMLPLVDTPIIQHVVQEAIASSIDDILIVTGRGKRAIVDHFDRSLELEYFLSSRDKGGDLLSKIQDVSNIDIYFIRQKEPLGLGHAVLQAQKHVGQEPFGVMLGDEIFLSDIPCLEQLIRAREEWGGTWIAVREVSTEDTRRYGIISAEKLDDGLYRVVDLVEKPDPALAPSNLAIVGRYVLEPEIFGILSTLPPGVGGEIQLTDALKALAQNCPVYALEVKGKRYDVGDKLGFLEATVQFGLEHPEIGAQFKEFLRKLIDELR